MLLVLSNKGKGMQSSSAVNGEDRCVTTLITAAKETTSLPARVDSKKNDCFRRLMVFANEPAERRRSASEAAENSAT